TEAPPISPLGPDFSLVPPQPSRMETWVETAVAGSLQVQIQRAAEEFAAKEDERNRSAHYPTVDVVGSYSDAGTGSGNPGGIGLDSCEGVGGLQYALPLFQVGGVKSGVREALSNLQRSRKELESARRAAAFETRQAFL